MALVPVDERNPRLAIRNPLSIAEPTPMSPFEFLFSFISLILGLAVATLLLSRRRGVDIAALLILIAGVELTVIGDFVGKGVF